MKKIILSVSTLIAVAIFITTSFVFTKKNTGSSGDQSVSIGGAFSLTDQDGVRVTNNDIKGKYSLVFFGFTNCPDICPTTLLTMTNVMEQLGEYGKEITPVFISVDTEDNPELMKTYLSNFHTSIKGLTGTGDEIKIAANAFRIYYAKVEEPSSTKGYTMDHSAYIYFMDKNGEYLTHFTHHDMEEKIIYTIKNNLRR